MSTHICRGVVLVAGRAELVIQPDASHSPWLDDSGWFVDTLASFPD